MTNILEHEPMHRILAEVAGERRRQDEKWGVQDHVNLAWNAILGEEVGEVARALLGLHFGYCDETPEESLANVREELIQVAAVAAAWIEAIDRRRA